MDLALIHHRWRWADRRVGCAARCGHLSWSSIHGTRSVSARCELEPEDAAGGWLIYLLVERYGRGHLVATIWMCAGLVSRSWVHRCTSGAHACKHAYVSRHLTQWRSHNLSIFLGAIHPNYCFLLPPFLNTPYNKSFQYGLYIEQSEWIYDKICLYTFVYSPCWNI